MCARRRRRRHARTHAHVPFACLTPSALRLALRLAASGRFAGLIGVAVACTVLPLNLLISRKLRWYNEELMRKRDKRVDFTNEVLQGIKALKLYAWEPLLAQQVEAKRSDELAQLRGHQLWLACIIFCLNMLPSLVTAVSFGLYSTVGGRELTPTVAFPSLIVFNVPTQRPEPWATAPLHHVLHSAH